MDDRSPGACVIGRLAVVLICLWAGAARAQESPYLYGIHDFDPLPQQYLNRFTSGGVTGWVTATVAVGHNPADTGGVDFRPVSNQGHTVICRINDGYCEVGTIPVPSQYNNFAVRCANFVQNSQGCTMWIIGNETNLASEWPPSGGHKAYVSPQDYANCFRAVYNAIKAVRPTHKVITQALAPWAGPYGSGNACGSTHDAQPLNWVQYLNQMLTAIKAGGFAGPDGIGLHINSRGYQYADIHSTQQISAGGQTLYFSFYVYKDWVNLGIPSSMWNLPLYATECNGNYYWKGGHPENPAAHYEPGWMQEIYAEINRYNTQEAPAAGKPRYRCVNMYRWCNGCDPWNIDGASNPYKGQILSDLDAAIIPKYRWDVTSAPVAQFVGAPTSGTAPLNVQFTDQSSGLVSSWSWTFGDGGVSTATHPVHLYTTPGTYTVSLTVSGAAGSNTSTRTGYITVSAPPPPGSNLISNGTFDAGLAGWTVWTQRNPGNNFSAQVVSGELRQSGTNYNAGVWQQFSTGGAGTQIDIAGVWRTNPTVAQYQWGEIIIINSGRTPANGVDEGAQTDNVLVYKNDTWAVPSGWNGAFASTSAVTNLGTFVAAGPTATILLKSGNSGPATASGVGFDNLGVVARAEDDIIIESRPGGLHHAWYAEEGVWANTGASSCASGTTPALGSRYGSTFSSSAGIKRAHFTPNLAAGDYRVYTTWPNDGTLRRNPILHRITHAGGVTDIPVNQTAAVVCPPSGSGWVNLGVYSFNAGSSGSVRISNDAIDVSGSMYATAVRFVREILSSYRGDFDADDDVDMIDFAHLQACLGAGAPVGGCETADLDATTGVGSGDMAVFIECLSGAGVMPPAACAQ